MVLVNLPWSWVCSPSSEGPRPLSVFDPSMEHPDEQSSSSTGVVHPLEATDEPTMVYLWIC